MGKLELRVISWVLICFWAFYPAEGQEWLTFPFEYSIRNPKSDQFESFEGSIDYRLSYQVDGRDVQWITSYTRGQANREGHLIDFTPSPGTGRLVLAFQNLRWKEDDHNSLSNFISLRPDVDVSISEGFADPFSPRFIIRNPDAKSAAMTFLFDPARISRPGNGTVTGRMSVQIQVLTGGKNQARKLFDFGYRLNFRPRAGIRSRPEPPPLPAEEIPLPATDNTPPVLLPTESPPPADTIELPSSIPGNGNLSVFATSVDAKTGKVLIRLQHRDALRIGEFRLSFQKRPASGGSWREVPYQNYKLEQIDDRRPRKVESFSIIYQGFGPGEYLVVASRANEHDSTFLRIDPASQPAAADFTQEDEHLHLRVWGAEPPFLLKYRPAGDTEWTTAMLNDSLYTDPLLTYFDDLQEKIPAFKKNGTYLIQILTAIDNPPLADTSLHIDRPWPGWRTLGWVGATLLVVGLIASLRYWWWKTRTFYE